MSLTDRIQHTRINSQRNIGYRLKDDKWQVIEYQAPKYNPKHWTQKNQGLRRSVKILKEFRTLSEAEAHAEKIRQRYKGK